MTSMHQRNDYAAEIIKYRCRGLDLESNYSLKKNFTPLT